MENQQRILQSIREINRRGATICERVELRRVQDVRRITMIVVRPVRHTANRGARAEILCLSEQRELGDESAVASTINADAVRIDVVSLREILRHIDLILKVTTTHVTVYGCSPVATVS